MPRYKNLTPHERAFLKHRHEVLTLIPSVELTALLNDRNKVSSRPGVYIMWKKDSDHVYIGESVNVSRRLIEHATVNYPTQYIDRDIRKYGPEHFRVAFLEECLAALDRHHEARLSALSAAAPPAPPGPDEVPTAQEESVLTQVEA